MTKPHGVLQVAELDSYTCHAERVYNSYKYKLVRAAFAHLPTIKDPNNQIRSKVCTCFWHAVGLWG